MILLLLGAIALCKAYFQICRLLSYRKVPQNTKVSRVHVIILHCRSQPPNCMTRAIDIDSSNFGHRRLGKRYPQTWPCNKNAHAGGLEFSNAWVSTMLLAKNNVIVCVPNVTSCNHPSSWPDEVDRCNLSRLHLTMR